MTRRGITIAIRLGGFVTAVALLPISASSVIALANDLYSIWELGNNNYINYFQMVRPIGYLGLEFIALYCFFSGRFVIERIIRGLEGRCPKCNYDLSGARGCKCPECGEDTA